MMATKLAQEEKFTIKSLTIESFRGYNQPQSFGFNNPVTVFCGHNGYGKSSTLYAIEWCLFGKVAFLPSLEGQSHDEVINQFNPKGIATVKLILNNGNGDVTLERTKKTGKKLTTLTIKNKDGTFEDDEAERKFFSLFGITLDDFTRAVYLHQEAIRFILTDDIAKRDEALDSLFGLERMRNIVKGIPLKDVKDRIKKLEEKKKSLNSKISGAIEFCNSNINDLKGKADENGLVENDLNLGYATKHAKVIIKEIHTILRENSIPSVSINEPSEVSDFKSFESKVKKIIKAIQQKGLDLKIIGELNSKKMELVNLFDSVKRQNKPIQEIQNKLNEIISNFGDLDHIDTQLSDFDHQLEDENNKRESLDVNSKLITDAIEALKTRTEAVCPVCNNKIDIKKTINDLEKQSKTIAVNQINEIDDRIYKLKEQRSKLENSRDDLHKHSQNLKDETSIQNDLLTELEETLEIKGQDKTKLLKIAKETSTKWNKEIENLEQSSRKQTEQLQKIRDSLDLIGIVISVLQKENELGTLNNLNPADSQEIENIDKAIMNMHKFEDALGKIVKVAGKVQTELASEMISSSQKDIGNFYSKLCMHKHYDKMRIDVKPREIKGLVKNGYAIKAFSANDGKETHVATRFSTGQMNCVALSVFFALTRALPVKLGFIILDDPSQNLDHDHKSALAEIISSISSERQVLISTQDDVFQSILEDKNHGIKLYEFSGWNSSGPKFN